MSRIAIVAVLGLLACRRTHPPGPGHEPEPTPPAQNAAAQNAPAPAPSIAPGVPAPTMAPGAPATTGAAAPTAGERAAMPDGGTLNGDPRGPRPAEVQRILDGALPDVRGCFDADDDVKSGETPVTVHFFVENPGYTGAITVQADAPKPVLDCVHAVYDKLKFPEFRGPKLELAPQFTYWKHARDLGAPGSTK